MQGYGTVIEYRDGVKNMTLIKNITINLKSRTSAELTMTKSTKKATMCPSVKPSTTVTKSKKRKVKAMFTVGLNSPV